MAEQGEPFPFSGRIVEAYYSNPELNTVAVMWSDGDKNREYYINVDEEDDQFQALLKEWSYESLDECTRNRNEATRQEFRDAFHRYATQQGLYTHGDPDGRKGETQTSQISFLILIQTILYIKKSYLNLNLKCLNRMW